MIQRLNKFIDRVSGYLAPRKGLLPLIGLFLILSNFIAQFLIPGWFGSTNLLLHLGLIIAIIGLMLAWAL
jgi:hypothetical protein